MRKMINSLSYDTKTAKFLTKWDTGHDKGSPDYYEESLYQKRTGEFFLAATGNEDTKYAKSLGGNQWAQGEMIIPLDFASAEEWAKRYAEPSLYQKYFGELSHYENNKRPFLYLQISPIAYARLNRLISIKKVSKAELIEQLIEDAEL